MSILSTIVNDVKATFNAIGSFLGKFEAGLAADLKFVIGNVGTNNLTYIVNQFIDRRMKALGATAPAIAMVVGFVGSVAEVVETEGQDEAADENVVQKFANAPEMVSKIAKISTSMAQKVVDEAAGGGKPAGGWKLWVVIIAVVHAIEMAGMIGISGIRTFVSDPAFLGQRWNTAVDAIGLHWLAFAQKPTFRSIGSFSTNDTEALFNYYKSLGATFIQNDAQNVQTIYNAADFMDELSFIYTRQLAKGGDTSKKGLTALIQVKITTTKTAPPVAAVSGGGTVAAPITPTKYYAGVIAQGVLQPAQSFTPQPKQIIESIADLTQVMHDNLAGYIAALGGKLRYVLEIVPRVILPDGSIAIASTVQVVSHHTKAGKPVYKTVVNRYAKLVIYMIQSDGQRRKLDEIVLGATDAINFQPTLTDLQSLATNVQTNIVAPTLQDVSHVVAPTEVRTSVPAPVAAEPQPGKVFSVQFTQAKGTSQTPFVAKTRAEAENDLIPWRFFQGHDPNGYPIVQLYVMVSPNVLYNTVELTLNEAIDLIKSYDRKFIAIGGQSTTLTGDPIQFQKPGSVELNGNKYLVVQVGKEFPNGIDDLIAGKIPPSNYVWYYQAASGEQQSFVPLNNIPLKP